MGQILFHKKDYKGAVREYDKALEINSGLAEIHNDMGNVFFEKMILIKRKNIIQEL